jgi:hypothetical protein
VQIQRDAVGVGVALEVRRDDNFQLRVERHSLRVETPTQEVDNAATRSLDDERVSRDAGPFSFFASLLGVVL